MVGPPFSIRFRFVALKFRKLHCMDLSKFAELSTQFSKISSYLYKTQFKLKPGLKLRLINYYQEQGNKSKLKLIILSIRNRERICLANISKSAKKTENTLKKMRKKTNQIEIFLC